jgi:hypothetical protein
MTAAQLAAQTKTHERYLGKWLTLQWPGVGCWSRSGIKNRKRLQQKRYQFSIAMRMIVLGLTLVTVTAAAENTTFPMARSSAAATAGCLPGAAGRVTINSLGPAESLHVEVFGLPPNTDFDLFVIQLPDKPFGLSWYQGDILTNSTGTGVGDFVGRFSIETFIVAPGVGPAPDEFPAAPFPDATMNPATNPIQTYHLGVWFNSPVAAAAAGCPNTVTPFNGTHNAGIQALSTRTFPELAGPLSRIK